MAFKWADRVKETTQTTGTGSLDLDGAATGYRAFSDELNDADETVYLIVDDPDSPSEYEIGVGTLTTGSPDSLSRDTVLDSSNSGNKINLQNGTTYTVIATIATSYLPHLTSGGRIPNTQAPSDPTGVASINGGPLGPINPFLNPSFDLAREGTSFTPSGSTLTYVLDHWGAFRLVGNYTISQVGSEGARRMRIQRDSGTSDTNAIVLVYAFRSEDVAHLAGQTVALNFSAVRGANFSAASNQVTVAIVEGQGTNESLADLRSGSWTSQANVVSSPVTIPSGLDRLSVSGDVSANATQLGIRITFTPAGTAGANDFFDITDVDLKIGATETPFARVPQDWALARSERHLTLKGVGTPCYASSATQVRVGVTFDEMVDTPTLSLTSSTPNVIIASSSELGSGSTIAAATVVNNGFRIIVDGFSGLTANEPGHINSTDLFKLDARL